MALFVLLSLTNGGFAQQAKDNVHGLVDFSGGLDAKTAPAKLDSSSGDVSENVRYNVSRTSLFKRRALISGGTVSATEPVLGMHRLYTTTGYKRLIVNYDDAIAVRTDATSEFSDILTVETGGYRWQWLTWHDLAIGTDGRNAPVKYDGTSDSATYLGACLATDTETGSGPDGTYTYKVSFYTASYEVGIGPASNVITASNEIELTEIPIGPLTFLGENVIGRRLYRTADGATAHQFLAEIANNTATTYTDSVADGDLGGAMVTDLDEHPPRGKLSIIHQDRLFIANNPDYPSRVYFSYVGSHDYFPADNYYDIRQADGDEITFLREFHGLLNIAKNNSIQKLYTYVDDVSWEISDPFNFIGCHAPYSAADSAYGVIYLGRDGIYAFNGQYSQLLSDKVSPIIEDISDKHFGSVWGLVHKNIYFLAYTSKSSGAQVNNRVLVYEIPSQTFSIDLLNIGAMCAFDSADDVNVRYFGSSVDGKVFGSTEEVYDITHRAHRDFGGTWEHMRYIPTGVPGGDENAPVIHLANRTEIKDLEGQIKNLPGRIARAEDTGTYISPSMRVNIGKFELLKWNQRVPPAGGTITVALRTSSDEVTWSDWSEEFSVATGADISAVTPDEYLQYRITMFTEDLRYSPEVYLSSNYVLKIEYGVEGVDAESDIPMRWRSGWTDLGHPARAKVLRRIECFYSASPGEFTVHFETYAGETDQFVINTAEHSNYYINSFTGGGFPGNLFRIRIETETAALFTFDKMIFVFDVRGVH